MVQFDATRRTLPGLERLTKLRGNMDFPQGTGVEVLHGCRQLVSRDVGLSPATSATPVLCCYSARRHSQETASDKLEEGGDDVKSSWPLCPGLHTCYNGRYKASQSRKVELIAESRSQFGLQAATRLHEAGIASNGASERRREYVPGPCTHRPSHHESGLY